MNDNNNIPKHWQIKKLREIGEIVSGGTPSTAIPEYWEGNISWISPADLSGYSGKYILKGRKSITENGLKHSSARIIPKGSILFSSRAPIGYVVIAGNEVCTNQGFKSIVPNNSVSSEYLYYYLKASKQKAEQAASGTTFKEISLKAFSQLEIPIPPLHEQQLIVSRIEELLSDLGNGKQQLLTAQQQLKVYRQSLLKAAFEGRLNHDSGEISLNHDSPDLPDGLDFDVNEKNQGNQGNPKNQGSDNLPKGWKWVKVGDVSKCIVPNRDKPKTFSGDIKWVTTPNLSPISIRLKYHDILIGLSESETKEYNARVIPVGSVIMTCVGTFGLSALVEKPIVINQQLHAFIPDNLLNSKYLAYCIQNSKSYFESKSTSTTIQYLNKENCNSMPLPLPPLAEQQLIVSILESKLTVCDKLEETIAQSLQQAESLRQSILKKAFEGKLVKVDDI
jgi:type I restriction enzyme, S subunit